jgi:hypothetical protein
MRLLWSCLCDGPRGSSNDIQITIIMQPRSIRHEWTTKLIDEYREEETARHQHSESDALQLNDSAVKLD